ncbi:MAG: phytoene synthase [Metallibacterium scheffleri]
MSSAAAASFVQQWRVARPLRDLALRFLPADESGLPLLLALEAELLGILHANAAPQVAGAKLAWWTEELAGFGTPAARHPLSLALATDARAVRVAVTLWPQAAVSVLHALEAPASADFAAQLQAAEALAEPFARIECAFVFGVQADCARTRRVLAVQHLGSELLQTPQRAAQGRLPLPMQSLARHALARARLDQPGAARAAALAEQCAVLAAALHGAADLPGPVNGLRAAEAAHDRRALLRAARAAEPLQTLLAQRQGLTPAAAFACWRAARAQRRHAGA